MDICLNCNGAIGEPGMAYGYAGKWCYCPIHPDRLYRRPTSRERLDIEQERLKKIEDMYHQLFHEWNEQCEEDCSSFGHSEKCKMIDISEAKKTMRLELERLRKENAELRKDSKRLEWMIEESILYYDHKPSGWLFAGKKYDIAEFLTPRFALDTAMNGNKKIGQSVCSHGNVSPLECVKCP